MDALNDFIAKKRAEFESVQARHLAYGSKPTFNMRLKVRLGSKLNTHETQLKMRLMNRQVLLQSRGKEQPINSSEWVVLVAKRFRSIEAAAEFGLALQASVAVMSALKGYSIDVGADNIATTSTSDIVKAAVAKVGSFLLDDIHGVDVFPNLPNSIIMIGEVTLATSLSPTIFVEAMSRIDDSALRIDTESLVAALLMNAAMSAPHPVAIVALSVAAVESLASGERWSLRQRAAIKELRDVIEKIEELSENEKLELANAVGGLNFGALEKTRRLIRSLDLVEILPQWEQLYRQRSKLFHGSKYVTVPDLQNMAGEARYICKRIFEAHIAKSLNNLPSESKRAPKAP